MPSTCVFEFDRADPIYFSGETVKACIKLNTTTNKEVHSVYLEFIGKAKVKWDERTTRTVNGTTSTQTTKYRAEEIYLNQRTTLFDSNLLAAGLHTYTTEIPLPISCPTSCTEEYGHIRYELSLIIDRTLRFNNEFHRPITVIKQLNLNLSPEYAIPLKAEGIGWFCSFCCLCASDPLVATLTIPFGGYAPGQKIRYKLELDNRSKYDLYWFDLILKQNYTFDAHTPSEKTRHRCNTLVANGREMQCLRFTKRVIEDDFALPSMPPTSNDCSIISVNYSIKLTIDCGTCHGESEMEIPITIGTVPILQSVKDPNHVASIQPAQPPTAPNMTPDNLNSDNPRNYDFYKPPSFEESTVGEQFIDDDINEHSRVEDFKPKYPMYTNFVIPSAPPPTTDDPAVIDITNKPLIA